MRSATITTLVLVLLLITACGTTPPSSQSSESTTTPETLAALTTVAPTPIPASESASSTSTDDTRPAADETLRILYWQAPTMLNPHLGRGNKDFDASRIIYEPLATYGQDGKLIPLLAAEIPSLENGGVAEDGKSVTWKLRRDVFWSDGEPFTVDDVLFTYEFLANPEVAATSTYSYDDVERVEVVDTYTIKVIFKDVNPAWALPFVGIRGMIIPRHLFEEYNGANIREAPANLMPVGTGPYRVVEFKPDDIVIYEPNPYYREVGKPFFGRVELKGGGDTASAARAVLQTGDADFAWNLQIEPQIMTELLEAGFGTIMTSSRPLVEYILINHTDPNAETTDGERSSVQFPHPFLSDTRVRQAFALAIDREAIATQLYGSAGVATSNILVEPAIYRSPNTAFEFDPQQAATLLDETGWLDHDGDGFRDKDGVKMSVLFQAPAGSVRQKTQQIVKQSLEAIGVEVELKSVDPSVFFDSNPTNTENYAHFYADLQMYTIPYDSPDPAAYMKIWTCDMPQQENNWSGSNIERWCNPAYDELYQQATTEMDPEKRRQLFIQMNDLLIEDVALIPLVHRFRVSGVSKTIEGVELTPWDADLWNIQDWMHRP